MEEKSNQMEFASAIKYAFGIRFGAPHSQDAVPTIGIAFGGPQLATLCHEYIRQAYKNNELRLDVTPGAVTAKVELKEADSERSVFSAELNYDDPELVNFQEKTPDSAGAALIFGFKRECYYYVTGNTNDKPEDFSAVVLAGFRIIR